MKAPAAATLLVAVASLLNAQTTDTAVNIQQVVVSLPTINAYVDVLSGDGAPVTGLKPQNFTASVSGQTLPFKTAVPFAESQEGMATVILLDTSASIGRTRFRDMKDTVAAWIGEMGPKDQTTLLTVGNKTGVVSPFTTDKAALLKALGDVNTQDETTALYLSLATGLRTALSSSDLPARRILLVLTDGKDDNPVS
ncbi:MAG TPA: VWA domain-containing protein, partial [Bryobacteraceae bacterium]